MFEHCACTAFTADWLLPVVALRVTRTRNQSDGAVGGTMLEIPSQNATPSVHGELIALQTSLCDVFIANVHIAITIKIRLIVQAYQGLTVDKAVVSLKKIFAAGQAYVALSRVRDYSGLIIQDFNEKAIYCKPNIQDAIAAMPPFLVPNIAVNNFTTPSFNVFLMNVQSLTRHVTDLALCTQHLQLNCIAVTETWLPAVSSLETVRLDGYAFHNHPRSLSYDGSNSLFQEIQDQQHGGVGMYSADNLAYSIIQVPTVNLECLVYHCTTYDILMAVIYRPPTYTMTLFKENLDKVLDWLNHQSTTLAVMGDFNDNILKSSTVCKFMIDKGFIQIVKQATTENGTLIDHVYVKTSQYDVECVVVPTYFSDHEGILCSFTSSRLE